VTEFELSEQELNELPATRRASHRVGWGVLLKCLQLAGRFPDKHNEVAQSLLLEVATSMDVDPKHWSCYQLNGRVAERHKGSLKARPYVITTAAVLK
jgi:hypothetical protein